MISLAILQEAPRAVTFVDFTKDNDASLAWLILGTFGLIAVVLLITLGLGAGFGMLRIWIMKRYPANTLNGPDDEPHIRLHLNDA